MIPYSLEVFFAVLAEYNGAVWPVAAIAWVLGVASVVMAVRGSGGAVAAVLVFAWAWTGAIYHLVFFTDIDFWSYGFGALFIVQSLLMAWAGLVRGQLCLRFHRCSAGWAGLILAVTGLVVTPVVGLMLDRELAEIAVFGVAPAPTVIVTLGLLLLAQPASPWHLFILPTVWCVIGGAVAIELPIPEDLVLIAAGVVALVARCWNRKGRPHGAPPLLH